jgi:hypothetical protein
MLEAVMGWIEHDGGKCPCVGEWVSVLYSDGAIEHGLAYDHAYWRYVTHYRLIAPPQPQ